jgi:hypothetical protein
MVWPAMQILGSGHMEGEKEIKLLLWRYLFFESGSGS